MLGVFLMNWDGLSAVLEQSGVANLLSVHMVVLHTPIELSIDDISEGLAFLAMLAILIHRFARTRREQDRVEEELALAAEVQHVLIPERLPEVAGFRVEAAYVPAQVVGGNSFQVLPTDGGGVLVVVGDVAGKGIAAGMTVSMLVGAVRTAAEATTSPVEVLRVLNRRLLGRGAGLTTCVAVRISADVEMRVASAGHLAPYWNGWEMRVETTLPMGVVDGGVVSGAGGRAGEGDRMVLVTDVWWRRQRPGGAGRGDVRVCPDRGDQHRAGRHHRGGGAGMGADG